MHRHHQASAPRNALARAAVALALAGAMAMSAGCSSFAGDTTASIPFDYRQRHPITIKEGNHTIELFVGAGRGGLSPTQRAEVVAFARNWRREATGGITIDRPVGTANARAATDTLREVVSILVSAGVPNHGIGIKPYRPPPGRMATIRLRHPRMQATAGPCGLWPQDLGPSYDPSHYENLPYWNLGCAHQRNLAAMVENPADLVQPRGEAPAYTGKRAFGIDKWRKGESPATTYPDSSKGAISDLGK